MYAVPPDVVEPLSGEIGTIFGFDELGDLLHRCEGRKVIHEVANAEWPRARIARECLMSTEKTGTVRIFLGLILAARPNAVTLRELIERAFPGLTAAPLSVASAAGNFEAAVDKTSIGNKAALDPQLVAAAIGAVSRIIDGIGLLETYKNLHDSLHRVQTRQFFYIRELVRSVAASPDALISLQSILDQVVNSHATAAGFVAKLPETANVRATEQFWVDKLAATIARFQQALDPIDVATISACINLLRNMVEREQPRLNRNIMVTASGLPLQQLTDTLEAINAKAESAPTGIAQTGASLRELRAAVISRVTEHNMWQDADDMFWGTDNLFVQGTQIELVDFNLDWPKSKAEVIRLSEGHADELWAKNVVRYAGQVDATLLEFDKAMSQPDPAAAATQARANLKKYYLSFRQEARMRFFFVDQMLKSDCAELDKIGPPLQSLLKGLSNG